MSDGSLIMLGEECWTRIGVWGDRTCAELSRVSHCRNCEVYAAGGRKLLDRPVFEDYAESWTALLEQERGAATLKLFHIWCSGSVTCGSPLPAASLREITQPRIIRRVPHRPVENLLGLVNVRGELHPCVSLHLLFGEQASTTAARTGRFFVARWNSGDWVFPVDQVEGMHDIAEPQIEPLPATLKSVGAVYTKGLFRSGDKSVAIIDDSLLFPALERRLA